MDQVYSFSNENLSEYNKIYNFKDAKVLTVLGSGDQYFSSLLFGAKEVITYDINPLTYQYFILKYKSILFLDYDEFYNYFIENELKNIYLFNRFDMPNISSYIKFSDLPSIEYDRGDVIPYFEKNAYYELKELLKNTDLPKFYNLDLRELYKNLNNEEFDIMLCSNIYYWLNYEKNKLKNFKKLLNKYNVKTIEAIYSFGVNDEFKKEFIINEVKSSRHLKETKDVVMTLKK